MYTSSLAATVLTESILWLKSSVHPTGTVTDAARPLLNINPELGILLRKSINISPTAEEKEEKDNDTSLNTIKKGYVENNKLETIANSKQQITSSLVILVNYYVRLIFPVRKQLKKHIASN